RQGGALAHELSVSSERAGEDRLAADLDRFLELQIQGRGSDRPGQPEAGDGEGAGLEETAACSSASRCHGETSDSEWDRDDWFSEGGKSKRVRSPRLPCAFAIRFATAGDAPFQHRRADHPGIGADEGRPARRQAQRGSNFLKAVRLPSDTTSPKADISTWPEADIFIWLL